MKKYLLLILLSSFAVVTFSQITPNESSTNISCFGSNDGTASVAPTGPGTTYTYTWTTSETTASITGLASGNYGVTIVNNLAQDTAIVFTITEPSQVATTMTGATSVTCNGGSDGTASVAGVGGTPPYTYLWSNAETTANLTGLSAGTYTATATDANSCVGVDYTITITQPTSLTVTISSNNISCAGANDGDASAVTSGGTPGYTYLWSNSGVGTAINSLTSAAYTLTVTDNNNCEMVENVTITEPSALTITLSCNNTSAQGATDGSSSATVSGGTPSYSYLWSTSQTSNSISGLGASTYGVTATDANACTISDNCVVSDPPCSMTASTTLTDANCNGESSGWIQVTPSGGTPTYTYQWSSGGNTSTETGLPAGNYTVTITDASSCVITVVETVSEPTALSITTSATDVSCNGGSDGTASATVSGGTPTPTYTYSWNNGASTSSTNGLTAALYSVTVTDGNSCEAISSSNVNQPTQITAAIISTNDATCNGNSDGSATVSANGGITPYSYQWNDPNSQTSPTATALSSGSYTVTVFDANSCTGIDIAAINEPAPLAISSSFINSNCGLADGAASVTVTGGAGGYTYQWDNAVNTPENTGIFAGVYTCTVTDANSCTITDSGVVNDNGGPTVSILTYTDATCFGVCDGMVQANVTGGSTPFNYQWNNGQTNPTAINLCGGNTYTVSVTDNFGCVATVSQPISDPAAMIITVTTTDVTCFGNSDGSAQGSILSGGVTPYTYNWSNGGSTLTITGIPAGSYSFDVTDANGCVELINGTVNEPTSLVASVSCTNTTMVGGSDGSSSASVSGGTIGTGYSYVWSSGSNSATTTGLAAGVIAVTVTDGNSCSVSATCVVNDPGCSVTASTTVSDVSCFGNSDGFISLFPAGGATPYSFNWSNGATSQDLISIGAGGYSVTITDISACTFVTSGTISEPTAITLTQSCINTSGAGSSDGSSTTTVSGGTTNYTYAWSNGSNLASITGIPTGSYTVTVTDANGCAEVSICSVTSACSLSLTTASTSVTCNGASNGSLQVLVSSGATPYTYNWSNGAATQSISGISAGTYIVTVADFNACTTVTSGTIIEPTQISVSQACVDVTIISGSDGSSSATVSGGNSPYSYIWSNGSTLASITGLDANIYTVTVIDASSCESMSSCAVNSPSCTVSSSTTVTDINCGGGSDGAVFASMVGGVSPYSYNWSNGATTSSITGLFSGTYDVTITDGNSCVSIASEMVTDLNSALVISTSFVDALCNGDSNGQASAATSGGVTPYAYSWSNGGNSQVVTGIPAGVYMVNVLDAASCVDSAQVIVGEPTILNLSLMATDASALGASDGAVASTVTGGTTGYGYNWSNGATTASLNGVSSGTYFVTILDANGCSVSDSAFVNEPNCTLTSSANVISIATCNGGSNGSAEIIVNGGLTPYSYLWSNGQTGMVATGLAANTYGVTATDAVLCEVSASVSITQPSSLSITSSSVDAICYGGNSGQANVTVTGGLTPYSYYWSNGDLSNSSTGLTNGTYNIVATDAGGCTISSSAVVNQGVAISITTSSNSSTCGSSNGSISITSSGGAGGFTYLWDNGSTLSSISGLESGTYHITVTDLLGCVKLKTSFVGDIDGPTVSLSVLQNSNCGGADGHIISSVNGGTPPLTYLWSNGISYDYNNTAEPGQNSLAVTDAIGCVGAADIVLAANGILPPIITGNITSQVTGFTITSGTVAILAPNPYAGIPGEDPYIVIDVADIDTLGNYLFNNILPIGDYLVRANPNRDYPAFEGNIPTYYEATWRYDSASVITTYCDSLYQIDIDCIYLDTLVGTSTLEGTIFWDGLNKNGGRAGDPIPGLDISLEQIPGGIIAHTETDSTGTFTFDNVPVSDSSYTIHVDYPGLPMESSYVVDIQTDTIVEDLDFFVGDSTVYIPAATTSISEVSVENKSKVRVYPNPFEDATTVQYMIKENCNVRIEIFNVLGELVYSESYSNRLAGNYITNLSAQQLGGASSIYIAKVTIGNDVHTTRLVQSK